MSHIALYRGKANDNKWYFGSLVWTTHSRKNQQPWIIDRSYSYGGWLMIQQRHLVKADTVGQFTGYIDKVGVRVFEGDIVNACVCDANGCHDHTGKIFWNVCRYAFCLMTDEGLIFPFNDIVNMRVIGNIHDKEESE